MTFPSSIFHPPSSPAPAPHIPALRLGREYASLDQTEVKDFRTGEIKARVSVVNAGIIRKDLAKLTNPLKKFTHRELIALCGKAGDLFVRDSAEYAVTLAATSGLAPALVERNIRRIHSMLANMDAVLHGLTRGLDLDAPGPYCFFPATNCLGLVMPSNSPAVNSLWLPAIALKIPVIIKPGKDEPWTPYRLIRSFIEAGVPAEAFGFYPTDHEGANTILTLCGRALLFGDKSTTQQYANNPSIQIHGPGYSKILIGADQIDRWPDLLDLLVDSIAANGGRSCLNASAIIVPAHADEIAAALQSRLDAISPDQLAGFANPKMAEAIDAQLGGGLLLKINGGTYLKPTVRREPTLTQREYLFPFATVVEMPQAQMLDAIGSSLVVTAITGDEAWIAQLKDCPHIDRLNIGPISTMTTAWDQPHEGNLFEFLYKRRAFLRQ